MLEIVIFVALYITALVLMVKGALSFCNHTQEKSVQG